LFLVPSLALGWASIYSSRTCLYPLFPVIAAELGVSSVHAGFLSGFYFMVYVLFQIPAGFLMDRLGTKRCLVTGYFLSSLALIGTAVWGNGYAELLFFFGAQG
jgi:MFS family permease